MSESKRAKKQARDQELDNIARNAMAKLNAWTSFVRAISVPQDMYIALQTGRPELLQLAQPRELTKDECKALYETVGTLIETNMALRKHAEELAIMVGNWQTAFKGLRTNAERIIAFAEFRTEDEEDDPDEEAA